uniref:Uncharacterized protein n=1 Tax=Piliocolobus tephrosceles TaxID=591936 RepID=A0A8C9LP89_9PRIM
MNIVANENGSEDSFLFLIMGDEKGATFFLLAGPPETMETLEPRVDEVLEGKGVGKKGCFQGKVTNTSQQSEVISLLQNYISTHSARK